MRNIKLNEILSVEFTATFDILSVLSHGLRIWTAGLICQCSAYFSAAKPADVLLAFKIKRSHFLLMFICISPTSVPPCTHRPYGFLYCHCQFCAELHVSFSQVARSEYRNKNICFLYFLICHIMTQKKLQIERRPDQKSHRVWGIKRKCMSMQLSESLCQEFGITATQGLSQSPLGQGWR